jgi:alcohol dehydrogenase (cytochrome c)
LFAGDNASNLIAFDPKDGSILWHSELRSNLSNTPITYELDGVQYLVVAAGDTLNTFRLL